uniref:Photosystem II PsbX n=1 Tax=Picea abies TaxID=3329 RepID=UPI00267420C3|nr:Chain X, Photosystem II PsbX [Picea abies]8C29_x Chain x, Photosystem II PsbX [Picea abies]
MASATAISLALPMATASSVSQRDALKAKHAHGSSLFTTPNKLYSPKLASNRSRVVMHASQGKKEQSLAGLTSLALAAAMAIPEIAEAAGSGVSPSLKNFLLSIAAGGVVATAIAGAVIGVSNFDPVKRN